MKVLGVIVILLGFLYLNHKNEIQEFYESIKIYVSFAALIGIIWAFMYGLKTNPKESYEFIELARDTILSLSYKGLGIQSGGMSQSGKVKRSVSTLMKKKVAASQQWKCKICTNTLDETYEVDHTVALDNGGTNDMSNLRALCPHCHRKKTVEERINYTA